MSSFSPSFSSTSSSLFSSMRHEYVSEENNNDRPLPISSTSISSSSSSSSSSSNYYYNLTTSSPSPSFVSSNNKHKSSLSPSLSSFTSNVSQLSLSNNNNNNNATFTLNSSKNEQIIQKNANNNNDDNENNNENKKALTGIQRYRKGRSFGDTLFGKIRYGLDLETNEWIAIKENNKYFANNRISIKGISVKENLFNEIKIHKYLMSQKNICPYILKLLNVVQDQTYIYLILELIQGNDLFSFVRKNHELMEEYKQKYGIISKESRYISNEWENNVKKLFFEILLGVKYLHNLNICHRDLSLENCLYDNNNNSIKIIDFGMSKIYDITKNPTFQTNDTKIGKVNYMSPEVYKGEIYDARLSDVWSLGVMLLLMLIGNPPWNVPDQNIDKRFNMIYNGRLTDLLIYWNKISYISNHAIDLLNRIFKSQQQRITLSQIFKHPFFKHCNTETEPQPSSSSSSSSSLNNSINTHNNTTNHDSEIPLSSVQSQSQSTSHNKKQQQQIRNHINKQILPSNPSKTRQKLTERLNQNRLKNRQNIDNNN